MPDSDSILSSTKKILGLGAGYTPFDPDVITHINATFSVLDQLGVGPDGGFFIEDSLATWEDFATTGVLTPLPPNQLNLVKSYIFLKVRMLFDPPATSFLQENMNKQIDQMEWRLKAFVDVARGVVFADREPVVEEEPSWTGF
jgi:hypothetical protein